MHESAQHAPPEHGQRAAIGPTVTAAGIDTAGHYPDSAVKPNTHIGVIALWNRQSANVTLGLSRIQTPTRTAYVTPVHLACGVRGQGGK